MMTTVELFLKLSTEQKDKFCQDLIDFGLLNEFSPQHWNKTVKQMIKHSKGTLKKLYQSFKPLTKEQRDRFFDAMIEAGHYE